MPTSFARKWIGDGLVSRPSIAKRMMMDARLEVPNQVRELAVIGVDNAEKALVLFFDRASKSIAPNSADAVALIKRVIAVKMDYARKLALASDLPEAAALQFSCCRSHVEMRTLEEKAKAEVGCAHPIEICA
jgi:hypothetical protein